MDSFDLRTQETAAWMDGPRFEETTRLYNARQVVQQQGTISADHQVARDAADAFYERLRELQRRGQSITTFGPYSPGQAVSMKRMGIEGIYLGGWATSAKGSVTEDPGPDLASYPLNQVPDEAAVLVRALLTADRNQAYQRSRMDDGEREATPAYDYRPFIIADADTGHGGDAHVRNLIRRFVEVGVPGYHIEDQRPGTKKCGHQGGKVLVAQDEQIKRLNAARFQLDVMRVGGLIVARTDAESATLLDNNGDERDHPFILGTTSATIPGYKVAYLALLRKFHDAGVSVNGHLLYSLSYDGYVEAEKWLNQTGLSQFLEDTVAKHSMHPGNVDRMVETVVNRFADAWQSEAGLKTFGQAVAEHMEFRQSEGETFEISVEEWTEFARTASFASTRSRAADLGVSIIWDCERARTPEGYYQIQGGIDYAIARSLAVAPFADLLWMETKTADLNDAEKFASAIHAVYPDKMLAYNLSPSFSWDTTGMSDEEMKRFPEELGKRGFVFNFITYGGHQVDGLASEEFAQALRQDGMLALARLQRKFRLVESPYRTPQTLVGGPRMDGALTASSGRTATTRAMGKGSTQFQHLVQTEVPPGLLQGWLDDWGAFYEVPGRLSVELRPHRAGSDLLELRVLDQAGEKLANIIFAPIQDRRGQAMLSVRDQNTFKAAFRKRRLMTLMHLFLIHRYKSVAVHYLSPTDDNQGQTEKMKSLGIYRSVANEVGEIIVADVDAERVAALLGGDGIELQGLIQKKQPMTEPSSASNAMATHATSV